MTRCAVVAMSLDVRRTSPAGNGQGESLRTVGNGAIDRTGVRVRCVLEGCMDDIPFLLFWPPILLDKLSLYTVLFSHHDY